MSPSLGPSPSPSPRVVLVGPMGAGKTSVGKRLARHWGVGFRDTDHDIEVREQRPVSQIFIDSGEPHFRQLEREAVATALDEHDGVLALGGGAVMDAATRKLLNGQPVVFLQVGLSAAADRVGLGVSRPLLLGNVRGQIKKLLDERTPVYQSVARWTVVTDDLTPTEVVARIEALVEDLPHD